MCYYYPKGGIFQEKMSGKFSLSAVDRALSGAV